MARWIGISLTTLFMLVLLLWYLGGDNDSLRASADVPEEVRVDEPFELRLNLTNPTDEDQTIVSIGLTQALLDAGLRLEDMVPAYREISVRGNWHEYVFSIARRPVMPPGSDFQFILTLVASEPGTYDGSLTIWLDRNLQAIHRDLHVEAVED